MVSCEYIIVMVCAVNKLPLIQEEEEEEEKEGQWPLIFFGMYLYLNFDIFCVRDEGRGFT